MIYIGNDIIEISRINKLFSKYGDHFLSKIFNYNYYNINAVTVANAILPKFGPLYITEHGKKLQEEYVKNHPEYTALEIWMWVLDEKGNKICITDELESDIQSLLNQKEDNYYDDDDPFQGHNEEDLPG